MPRPDPVSRRPEPLSSVSPPPRVPAFVERIPTRPYERLNPLTKLVIAIASAVIAFTIRGWTGPTIVLIASLALAVHAGILRRTLKVLLLTAPLVISIVVVNTIAYPGATDVIARMGPFTATGSGLIAALQAVLRVFAFGLSVALFSMTTPTDDLLDDLERRGLGRRAVFVIGTAIGMVPTMRERGVEIADSQRARGLDTEGGRVRRVLGLVPLVGPMVFGALAEVEEQTQALEARGFSAPGRRTAIRRLPESPGESPLRYGLLLATAVAVAVSGAGLVGLP